MFLFFDLILTVSYLKSKYGYHVSPENYTNYYISLSEIPGEIFTVSTRPSRVSFVGDLDAGEYDMYVDGNKMCVDETFELITTYDECFKWRIISYMNRYLICAKMYDNVMRKTGLKDYCLKIQRGDLLEPNGDFIFELGVEPKGFPVDLQLFAIEEIFKNETGLDIMKIYTK